MKHIHRTIAVTLLFILPWGSLSYGNTVSRNDSSVPVYEDYFSTHTPDMSSKKDAIEAFTTDQRGDKLVATLIGQKKLQKARGDEDVRFEIQPQQKFQKLWGFGASVTESCLENIDRLNPIQKQNMMTKMFSPYGGGGLSYLRIPLGANDFSLGEFTLDDTKDNHPDYDMKEFNPKPLLRLINFAKKAKAQNPKLRLMISPWTPPAWMKDTQALRGGQLKKDAYAAYALYFIKSLEEFKKAGLKVDHLTIMNEPLIGEAQTNWYFPQGYMTPDDQAEFIAKYLGPKLAKFFPETKILMHDHNWDNAEDVIGQALLPQVKPFIAGIAYHCYGGDYSNLKSSLALHRGLPGFNSECSATQWTDNVAGSFQWWMESQSLDAVTEGTTGALGWNLCLDPKGGPKAPVGCDKCRGLVTVGDSYPVEVGYNAEFRALTQVSRYAQPDAARVATLASKQTNLQPVAFENPDGSKVFVVRNPTDKPVIISAAVEKNEGIRLSVAAGGAASLIWR